MFVMSSFLIIVYFTEIGDAIIDAAFWIVSTNMTALLMITYGFIRDTSKRKNNRHLKIID